MICLGQESVCLNSWSDSLNTMAPGTIILQYKDGALTQSLIEEYIWERGYRNIEGGGFQGVRVSIKQHGGSEVSGGGKSSVFDTMEIA